MSKSWVILGQIGERDIDWLVKAGHRYHLPAGEILIQHGEAIENLYLVIDGVLALLNPQGQQTGQLHTGAIIGELGLLETIHANTTLRAENDAVVLVVPRAKITARLEANADFAAGFYRGLATYLAQHIIEDTTVQGQMNFTLAATDTDTELGETVLDNVYLAGTRFDRISRLVMESENSTVF